MACKGKCVQLLAMRLAQKGNWYGNGRRYCPTCRRFLMLRERKCPCCGAYTRSKPKAAKYRDRYIGERRY